MSYEITRQAWALRFPVRHASAKLVLLSLADQANSSRECWPSLRYTALRTGLSERRVRSNLRLLQRIGLVSVTRRYKATGVESSCLYRLHLEPPSDTTPPPSGRIVLVDSDGPSDKSVNSNLKQKQPKGRDLDEDGLTEDWSRW